MSGRSIAKALVILAQLALLAFGLSTQTTTPAATTQYDSGNPTPAEQLVLEYINRARADPNAEGVRLGIDIHEGLSDPSLVQIRPPLAMNRFLLSAARAHSQDMWTRNYFAHTDPDGKGPYERMVAAGYTFVPSYRCGENIAAGSAGYSAAALEDLLMVDVGTAGRGHRVNLLDIQSPPIYSEVGIGYYAAWSPNSMGLSNFITQDFAVTSNAGPFLLGVVYKDLNGNNFYDIGEGVSGVTITPSIGTYYAISSASGGYAFPIGTSGTITVTASGPSFTAITRLVTLTGVNIKLDFGAVSLRNLSEASTEILSAPASRAYFIYANPYRMVSSSAEWQAAFAAYDATASGIIYGLCTNEQKICYDSDASVVVAKTGSGQPSNYGEVLVSGRSVVVMGGPIPNWVVDYYERTGQTPLKYSGNGTHHCFLTQTGSTVAALSASADFTHNDMFVVMVFQDTKGNFVLIIYGLGWKGTFAGGIYFKEVIKPSLATYTKRAYVFKWIDSGVMDGVPQAGEITEQYESP